MKKAIIGGGGFGREVYYQLLDCNIASSSIDIFDDNELLSFKKIKEIDFENYEVVIAIGDPNIRKKIVDKLPLNTKYFTFIHKSAQILDKKIIIGEGTIICPNVTLTTNIKLGNHCQLNINTSVGHDTIIGDYFTATPGVNISGNCTIGNNVYMGTNSSIREKTKITDNVIIGLNSGVISHINESGVYVGLPCHKIK